MATSEVERLYKCVVCPKAYKSKQSLRAHMKIHKHEGYIRTSFHAKAELWKAFDQVAAKHNTTTCQLLNSLMEATVEGEKQGLVKIGAPNPVIIQVQHVFMGAPRGRYSHVSVEGLAKAELMRVRCNHIGGLRPGEVYCQWLIYSWLPRSACETCSHNLAYHNP